MLWSIIDKNILVYKPVGTFRFLYLFVLDDKNLLRILKRYESPLISPLHWCEHLICEETLFTCKLLLLIHSVSFWIFLLTVSQSSKTARKCLNTNYLKMLLWNTVNWHNYNGSLDYYIVCFFVMGYGQWNEDFCIMLKHISVCGFDLLIIICLLFREAGWKKNIENK